MRATRLRETIASITLADLCQHWSNTLCVFRGQHDRAIPNKVIRTAIKSDIKRNQYEKQLTHLHVLILYYLAHKEVSSGLCAMGINESNISSINHLLSAFKLGLETTSTHAFFLHDPENPGTAHAYDKKTHEWEKQPANMKKNKALHIDALNNWIQQFRSQHENQTALTLQGIHYIKEWIASLNAIYFNLSSAF